VTTPPPSQPAALTPLSDPDNIGWVQEKEPLSDTAAYWRARGMVPPYEGDLEQ